MACIWDMGAQMYLHKFLHVHACTYINSCMYMHARMLACLHACRHACVYSCLLIDGYTQVAKFLQDAAQGEAPTEQEVGFVMQTTHDKTGIEVRVCVCVCVCVFACACVYT